MAPSHTEARLSDVECLTQKHQLLIEAMTKDAATVEQQLERVSHAVFGDQNDLKHKPGVIMEVARLEKEQIETNKILTGLREDFHRVAWIIVTANIMGLLALIIKK